MSNPASATNDGDHVLSSDAPRVTLMMYGDFECPSCGALHPIIREVRQAFGPNLRFIFRHFPLRDTHPSAERAAQATEAAGAQDKFWEMHERLYEHQHSLDERSLSRHARKVGLDVVKFERDLAAGAHAARVNRDVESGRAGGVLGTPSLFINGTLYRGPRDRASLVAALARAAMAPSAT